jgi:hypothetical protein
MYNQFYFLHINKNTAKTLGIRLFDPLYQILENNGISSIELNKNHASHNYWQDFDDKTYILSAVREPIERTISEFYWWVNYGDDGIRTHNFGRDRQCPYYTKDNFLFWIEEKYTKNYQSSIIGKNVNRINTLIKTEYIKNNENKLLDKILKDLGISYNFEDYPPDYEHVFMQPEKSLYDILVNDSAILNKINEYNQNDIELYRQASFIF